MDWNRTRSLSVFGTRTLGGAVRLHALANTLVFSSYMFLSLLLFSTTKSITHNILGRGDDPLSFVWLLEWWPWAILHGRNPLVTDLMWYPYGVNLTWVTSVPTLSLLGLPVTILMNSIVTYNLATLLAPALSAWTAYLLAKWVTDDVVAAWIGGYLFGFSSYELGHLLGHLNLDMIFVIPLLVLFSIKRLNGEFSRGRYIVLMTIFLSMQFGISLEIFATACLWGAVAWAIFLPFVDTSMRRRMWLLAADIIVAVALTSIITLPYLIFIFKGVRVFAPEMARQYSSDLLNYMIPTSRTRLGHQVFASISDRFTGNNAERGAYLGLPLILILILYFAKNLSHRLIQGLLIVLVSLMLCSLGPTMWINGLDTRVPLPWLIIGQLPLIGSAIPSRFTLYVSLVVSLITVLWLAESVSRSVRTRRLALAVIACLFLFPNTGQYTWRQVPLLRFFEPEHVTSVLGANRNILILPMGRALAMLWQWQANFGFSQSTGYIALPAEVTAWPVIGELWGDEPGAAFGNDLLTYCSDSDVSAILLAPGTPPKLRNALLGLGWHVEDDGEVTIVWVPDIRNAGSYSIEGDYFRGDPSRWMGRAVIIKTRERATQLIFDGTRPDGAMTEVRVEMNGATRTMRLTPNETERILIPPNAIVKIAAAPTFIPDDLLHNGDRRALSLHLFLSTIQGDQSK